MDRLRVNALVFGGGVAGLWILDELRRRGQSAVLLEAAAFGDGQTIVSQGILHSGLKYSLAGLLTAAAREAGETVDLWRRCLRGEGRLDLSTTKVLSPSFYLWRTDTASSKIGMLGARIGLRVTPQLVPDAERPAVLRGCPGSIYRVEEQVLAPASLLATLAEPHRSAIVRYDVRRLEVEAARPGEVCEVRIASADGSSQVAVAADWIILAAGNGNAGLRERCGLDSTKMQRRPLHMPLVRGDLPEFFGHCVDGAKTRVTITSARDSAGRTVWQVGGQISEEAVDADRGELIRRAQAELAATMPGIDLRGTEWTTFRIDRAEGTTLTGGRPDSYRLYKEGNVLTVWPTKLVLAPTLAAETAGVVSQSPPQSATLDVLASWPRPEVAPPQWDRAHDWLPFTTSVEPAGGRKP